jgi:phosphoribosylformylglycinamidine synthase subunit PurS
VICTRPVCPRPPGTAGSAGLRARLTGRGYRTRRADVRGSGGIVGFTTVARVVVDVMPKPEILDPQGQAVTGALARIGIAGVVDVRQGKHFELEVDDAVDDETLHRIAGQLLANPVIEDWTVTRG